MTTRECKGCKTAFEPLRGNHRYCSDTCRDENALLYHRYNMTLLDYQELARKQDHQCAICGSTGEDQGYNMKKGFLVIDHNHRTGKVRELLCSKCNRGIGSLQDSRRILIQATKYLFKHQTGVGEASRLAKQMFDAVGNLIIEYLNKEDTSNNK